MTYWQKVIKYCALAFALFIIVTIAGGLMSAGRFISYFFEDTANRKVGDMKTHDISNDIDELEIELGAVSLEIRTGGSYRVETNYENIIIKEKDKKLKIEEEYSWLALGSNAVVIVYIPENKTLEEVELNTGAGKVSIGSLNTETLKMDFGAGRIIADKLLVSKSAKINGGTGEISINSGSIKNPDIDMGVGKFYMKAELTGHSKLDFGVGDAEIVITGNKEDYRIKVDKGIGSITVDGESLSDGEELGSGDNTLDIDGGIGSVNIKFVEK